MPSRLSHVMFALLLLAATYAMSGVAAGAPDRARQRETLSRMMVPITIELSDNRLEDVVRFISDFTGADLEPIWRTDRDADGLDKEARVTVSVTNVTVLAFLERILRQSNDGFIENTWQLGESGALEFGPKSRLNRLAFLKTYDIQDMLYEIPDFVDVPTLDLDQILQQSGQQGGGGGGSIFQGDQEGGAVQRPREELAQELINLIIENIEPEQWIDNGGDGGTIRYYNGFLLVRAPDYMHRQLGGYPFMSQRRIQAATGNQPRRAAAARDRAAAEDHARAGQGGEGEGTGAESRQPERGSAPR